MHQMSCVISLHDLEGYFESLAPQGFQNNLFPFWHEEIGVSAPFGGANLPSRVTINDITTSLARLKLCKFIASTLVL